MNACSPVDSMKWLEGAGLSREQAEAIALEPNSSKTDHVTKPELDAALDKLFIKIGVMTTGIVALACTLVSVLNHF